MSAFHPVIPLKRLMLIPAASLTLLLAACASGGQAVAVPQTSTQPATSSTGAGGSFTDVTTSSDSTTGSTEDLSTEQSATEQSSTGQTTPESSGDRSSEQSSTEESSTQESTQESSTESSTEQSSTDESTTDESTTDESTTSSSTSSSSQPARTSPGSSGGAPAAAVKIAAPGTTLKIGETANLHKQVLESSNPRHTLAIVEAKVTKIQKADPKIFDRLKNKADFKGLTPYFIFAEYRLISIEGNTETGGSLTPVISGVLQDGSDAGMAIGFGGGLAGCEDKFFQDNKIGDTATLCYTALARTTGAPVIGAKWEGDDYIDGTGVRNKYKANPVVWTK